MTKKHYLCHMLYIYRASAGSGKTFLLTGFYIRLLFLKELTPGAEGRHLLFSEILAVTFTNKATAEMKERIIKELFRLWKEPQKSPYYHDLIAPNSQGKSLTDSDISNRARQILTNILDDYSNLHISTIDKFFQQVVRSFAHELDMQYSYEIELDERTVLDQAVSNLLLTLSQKEDDDTYRWIVEFSKSNLQKGETWNIHKELLRLAQVLTTEAYREVSPLVQEATEDKTQLKNYADQLIRLMHDWRRDLKTIGQACCNWMEQQGLTAKDFKGSSTSAATNFVKWANGTDHLTDTLRDWSEDPDKWFTKTSPWRNSLSESAKERLLELLQKAVEHMEGEPARRYHTANLIAKNIYQLGLLSHLEKEANAYCEEQGIKLLSNTTQMLNALVKDEHTPFIYEKTGTRIQSYMIDEFQDTSGMQWQNFSPLLADSLGRGNQDLIVGDVKQSIYRWRGSDWSLLHQGLDHFMADFHQTDANGNKLIDNWRSDRKIIQFNNEFFTYASQRIVNDNEDVPAFRTITDIYSDVEQKISEHRKNVTTGTVTFEILKSEEGEKYNLMVEKRLPELVIALQQQIKPGTTEKYRPEDIMILCRTKGQAKLCANALLHYKQEHLDMPYGMEIVTEEALMLYIQPSIRAIVAALEYLHEPKSPYRIGVAIILWEALTAHSFSEASIRYMRQVSEGQPTVCQQFDQLLNAPLYEAVERLIGLLPPKAREDKAYLNAFRDVVLDYCNKEGTNLGGFLEHWKDKGTGYSITTPSELKAIRIMTIHKSKGLDGEAVIVPFTDDLLDIDPKKSKNNLLWCRPKVEPFNELPHLVVPINLVSEMAESYFDQEYQDERLRTFIDNLNTAYVAFTRARHSLILLTAEPSKTGNQFTLNRFLRDFFQDKWQEGNDPIQADMSFLSQEENTAQTSDTETDSSPIYNYNEEGAACFQPVLPIIKQTEYQSADSPAARGTTLHAAFSAIVDRDHIDEPIRSLFRSGEAELLGFNDLDEVLSYVHQALGQPEVQEWFAPENQVLTEQDIITKTTHTQRPDRIVFTPDGRTLIIDYKTGEQELHRYHNQVATYMNLMRQMGFPQIHGYLWYIESGKIVEVQMRNKK